MNPRATDNDVIPAYRELATGTPVQQISAATLAIHTWLTPRIETGNAVPVSPAELDRLRFLMDCIDRATQSISLAQDET